MNKIRGDVFEVFHCVTSRSEIQATGFIYTAHVCFIDPGDGMYRPRGGYLLYLWGCYGE